MSAWVGVRGITGGHDDRVPYVFVSYSRQEFHAAEALSSVLAASGQIRPWLDVEHLRPGTDWETAINAAIDHADAVVVVASPAAMVSPVGHEGVGTRAAQGHTGVRGVGPRHRAATRAHDGARPAWQVLHRGAQAGRGPPGPHHAQSSPPVPAVTVDGPAVGRRCCSAR